MVAYSLLVGVVALQRLFELYISRKNEQEILAAGGKEVYPAHFFWMKLLHVSWLLAILLEVWTLKPRIISWVVIIAWILFICGQCLRCLAMSTLRQSWCVKIMVCPQNKLVHKGIYHYIRHPNYLGVILEVAALPLIYCAFYTSMTFSFLNLIILIIRIKAEEAALQENNQYNSIFSHQPRFFPALFAKKHREQT
ncbi:MAG: isoprenylcysteine carboxyl methyltransferase [SAR324 cluster bacterium]|uniref:Isoprenylcysteine carboxyl methyltransferase n=1 Tax=SAR324 cluster bacterium TaxID=2024889 RepID=A0A2A4T583_9DELT|nr:MAG: isoprenylcysteine carboxyl methyltransferase [SAR324 cluster bacterium]